MERLIYAVLVSFAMSLVAGPLLIPWLKRMKFGQTIYDLGPQSHKVKQGVPTMGGLIFALPMLLTPIIIAENRNWALLGVLLGATAGFGLIGFADDFIKVTKKRSLGLTPRQKLVPQFVISLALSIWAYRAVGGALIVPFSGYEWNLGWAYIPVMTFILVGTVNSANLLDGLDGLLGGCALIDFAAFAIICLSLALGVNSFGVSEPDAMLLAVFCASAAGALLGFLRFNSHPAGVFMGDVGSFLIGGAMAAVAMVTRMALLLPVIALAMLASSLSDIIQVGWFKYTKKKYGAGRRVFKMAPLHHHFELSGMPETRIVSMYMIVTVAVCLMALTMFVS